MLAHASKSLNIILGKGGIFSALIVLYTGYANMFPKIKETFRWFFPFIQETFLIFVSKVGNHEERYNQVSYSYQAK